MKVLDNTYEHFVYGGREHYCAAGSNVINIFSFSKAYGMMGWRMGYVAFPAEGDVVRPARLAPVPLVFPHPPVNYCPFSALVAQSR